MANQQTKSLRKASSKDPHTINFATRTLYKAGGHNGKKHDVEMKDIGHGSGAFNFDPERARRKQRHAKQRQFR